MDTLSAEQIKSMLLAVAGQVVASQELLCEADRSIGDGDHGIGMAAGFEAVAKELESHEYTDAYAVFSTAGRTMIRVMGGASGIIFGLLFYGGAKGMPPQTQLTVQDFAQLFARALAEIQAKGQARPGDKTLVDGLAPVAQSMQASAASAAGFAQLFQDAALAAEQGKEQSKGYVARFGKASALGERAVGYPDPGCVSLVVITTAMRDWASQNL
jgi:dihydroxyacetone kinase phosphoprotein-dependent L subunit